MILTNALSRTALPKTIKIAPETKAWESLQSSVGKDTTKFTVPSNFLIKAYERKNKIFSVFFNLVELHEPLSMLQRLCEAYDESILLEKTQELEKSALRLAFAMAFVFSGYSASLMRITKPFEPILGETFEFTPQNKKFNYFAELVAFNPSLIATYCESTSFKAWSNINLKSVFYGKFIEYRPIGVSHIILNKHGDHIIFTKPVTNIENILPGPACVEHYGDMNFTNLTTHETGVISINKSEPNDSSSRYCANGYIKNAKGKAIYNIIGKLNENLRIIDLETQNETVVWEVRKNFMESLHDNQYFFSDFALQLNHLNQNLLMSIASTDSRLRPDMRALEYLDYKICGSEKKRIEENEKKNKEKILMNNETWKPKWFVSEIDEVTKLKTFAFVGMEKKKEDFSEKKRDIF